MARTSAFQFKGQAIDLKDAGRACRSLWKEVDYAEPYAGIAAAYAVLSLFGVISGKEGLPD